MKKLWLIMLAVALAFGLVFGIAGCRDVPEVVEPGDSVEITDPDEIGALLSAANWGGSLDHVIATKNVAHFNIPATGSTDNNGFKIAFPAEAAGTIALEVTFKLIEVTTLKAGENAKIGFKSAEGSGDVTPYDDYELIFGDKAGVELTQAFPLSSPNKLPNNAVWFSHNKYGSGDKKGSDPAVNYKLEITKLFFMSPNSFVKVTGINNVPAKGVKGMPLALPANASPDTANFTDVAWAVKVTDPATTTGATITGGNLLNTTATGKVTVTATVAKGLSDTEDFTKDFVIEIVEPNGTIIKDFSGGTGSADAVYTAATNTWALAAGYKAVKFGLPVAISPITPTDRIYKAVTIVYSADGDARYSFSEDGSTIGTTLDGKSHGSWGGTYDLTPSTMYSTLVINIPDIKAFNGYIFDSKAAAANIKIAAVYFEKRGEADFCTDCKRPLDECTCFVPVTSIAGVKASEMFSVSVSLVGAKAFPSYATVKTPIVWYVVNDGGTGATISSNTLSGATKEGKVKIRGIIVEAGADRKDYIQDFEIDLFKPKSGTFTLDKFGTSNFGYGRTNLSGNKWKIGGEAPDHQYQRAGFDIGDYIVSANYASIEIKYAVDADDNARFGIFLDGTRLRESSDPVWTPPTHYQGYVNLGRTAGDTATTEKTVTITIDNNGIMFNQFAMENKEGGYLEIDIKSVRFIAR